MPPPAFHSLPQPLNLPVPLALSQSLIPGQTPIRLWHNLARSGSTLIGRCLGSMNAVKLLSEIHPLGARFINPVRQACRWHDLLSSEEIARFQDSPPSYRQIVVCANENAARRRQTLVVRGWEHLDYYGRPFVALPTMRPSSLDALEGAGPILRVATVRHPIDQWMSLASMDVMQGHLDLEAYLTGYRRFVETCLPETVIRYEDFTQNPDRELRRMCDALQVEFDARYRHLWPDYDTITGDTKRSRGLGSRQIVPLPRREVEHELLDRFQESKDYRAVLDALGYGHPI